MLSIVVSAGVDVAQVWMEMSTFGGKTVDVDIYFDSMEGMSANKRFMARGESPEARRRWRARWL